MYGITSGSIIRGLQVDARSLDYSSYGRIYPKPLNNLKPNDYNVLSVAEYVHGFSLKRGTPSCPQKSENPHCGNSPRWCPQFRETRILLVHHEIPVSMAFSMCFGICFSITGVNSKHYHYTVNPRAWTLYLLFGWFTRCRV